MKICIIGAGNVGTNLHHAFSLKGINATLCNSRQLMADSQQPTANRQPPTANSNLPMADIYIYTVADHALAQVVAAVHAPKALHLHTSGSMQMDIFGEDKPHAGILYFFQTFSKEHLIDDWSTIPCFIEGRNIDDIAAIYSLAQNLTGHLYETTQAERERLHVAGVFANNFTNLMYRLAAETLSGTSIPFAVLLPLIDRTAEKIHTMRPEDAQTGPAKRHDEQVMAHHMELLDGTKRTIYQLLSAQIQSAY